MNKDLPIGVFDSGIGGLTVLEEMAKIFPYEDFVYVADQGHCPYGIKTEEEITECILNVGKYLINTPVKAIVVACNTASLFIDKLKEAFNVPVISVIEPTALYAMNKSINKKIIVLGTIATINKGKYQDILTKHGCTCQAVPCSEFVDFLENHDLEEEMGKEIVKNKLSFLRNSGYDTVIHGCTHFSLLEPRMKEVLGELNYVACGIPTSNELYTILKNCNLLKESNSHRFIKLYTTGDVACAKQNMKWFKTPHEEIKKICVDK